MDTIRRLLLLRNALASATSPLARQLLDACATVGIVVIVVATGIRTLDTSLASAQAVEGMTLATSEAMEAVLVHAESGRWPAPETTASEDEPRGRYTDRIVLGEDGSVHTDFTRDAHRLLRTRRVTIRPVPGGNGATLRWQLLDDDVSAGERVNPALIPHAWRLDD